MPSAPPALPGWRLLIVTGIEPRERILGTIFECTQSALVLHLAPSFGGGARILPRRPKVRRPALRGASEARAMPFRPRDSFAPRHPQVWEHFGALYISQVARFRVMWLIFDRQVARPCLLRPLGVDEAELDGLDGGLSAVGEAEPGDNAYRGGA